MSLIAREWAAILQTLPLDQSGRRVVTAFVRAIEERVPAAIPPLVLDVAMTAPENGVARFVNQIVGKNLKITPTLVGRQRENRASLRFFLTHPEKPDWAQAMWFLLEKVPVGAKESDWRIAGLSKHRSIVGLFLHREFDADMTLDSLEDDSTLREWWKCEGEGTFESPPGKACCFRSIREVGYIRLEGNGETTADRFLRVHRESPGEKWRNAGLRPRLSLESLLMDLNVPWSDEEE